MPVRELLLLGNPKLWQSSSPVADVRSSEVRQIIADLSATLEDFRRRHGFGRAIAAPQIGAHSRLIFLNLSAGTGEGFPLINPVIGARSEAMMELWDDCFSFPDLMVRVMRHRQIEVRYQNEQGEEKRLDAEGDLSELLQHEIDHLDGILATDRAIDGRSFALRSEVMRQRSS